MKSLYEQKMLIKAGIYLQHRADYYATCSFDKKDIVHNLKNICEDAGIADYDIQELERMAQSGLNRGRPYPIMADF